MAAINSKKPIFYEALKIELEKKLSDSIQSLKIKKKVSRNNILYHYTNLNGLIGIINNQCLFSSNSAYLNDKEEFYYGHRLFKEHADKICPLKEDKEKILTDEIVKILNSKVTSYHYATCFSLEGDLLSQWRAYADDGKGISIGFDSKKIAEAFEPKASGVYIVYDEATQLKAVEKIFDVTFDFYISKLLILEKLEDKNMFQSIAEEINEIFDKYIGQFKHSSFKEEREYRFDLSIDKDINKSIELSYRVSRNNLLVPYLHLKTNYHDELERLITNDSDRSNLDKQYKIKKLPIKEIIIGPSIDYELNKKSIEGFLKKNGYGDEIEIKKSNVPYRI